MATLYVKNWENQAAFEADTAVPENLEWGQTAFNNLADAVACANSGDTVNIIGTVKAGSDGTNGTLTFSDNFSKNLTFNGDADAKVMYDNINFGLKKVGGQLASKIAFNNIDFVANKNNADTIHIYYVAQNGGVSFSGCEFYADNDGKYLNSAYLVDIGGYTSGYHNVVFSDCEFRDGRINVGSGAQNKALTFDGCAFSDAPVNIQGGDYYSYIIKNCEFSADVAERDAAGGIYMIRLNNSAKENSFNISNSTFNFKNDTEFSGPTKDGEYWTAVWLRDNSDDNSDLALDGVTFNGADIAGFKPVVHTDQDGNPLAADAFPKNYIVLNNSAFPEQDETAVANILAKTVGPVVFVGGANSGFYNNGVKDTTRTVDPKVFYLNSDFTETANGGIDGKDGLFFNVTAFDNIDNAIAMFGSYETRNNELEKIVLSGDVKSISTGKLFFYTDRDVAFEAENGGEFVFDASANERLYFMDTLMPEGSTEVSGTDRIAKITIGKGVTLKAGNLVNLGQAVDSDDLDADGKAERDGGAAHLIVQDGAVVSARAVYVNSYSTFDIEKGGLFVNDLSGGRESVIRSNGVINITGAGDGTVQWQQSNGSWVSVQGGTIKLKDTAVDWGTLKTTATTNPMYPEKTGSKISADNSSLSIYTAEIADGAVVDLQNKSSLTITNGNINISEYGKVIVTDSTLSAKVVNNGTFTVSSTDGKSSTLKIDSLTGNAIIAEDGTTLKDSTIKGVSVETNNYTYALSVNGDDAGTLNLEGDNIIQSIDAGNGDTVNVSGKLSFDNSDGFKLSNGAVWNIENAEVSAYYLSLDGACLTPDTDVPAGTMTFTKSTGTFNRISSKSDTQSPGYPGTEIGYGKFNVTFDESEVVLTSTSAIQLQVQDTAEINLTFKNSMVSGTNGTAVKDFLNYAAKSTVTFDATNVVFDSYFQNDGTVIVKNGANVTFANGSVADVGNNTSPLGHNTGVINVDGATLAITGNALDNSGTINVSGASALNGGVVDDVVQAISFTGDGWVYMNNAKLDENTKISGANIRFASGHYNLVENAVINMIEKDGTFTDKNGKFQVGAGYRLVSGYTDGNRDKNVDFESGVTVTVRNSAIGGMGDATPYGGWVGSEFCSGFDKSDIMTEARYTLNIENSVAAFAYLHVSDDGILNVTGHSSKKFVYGGNAVDFQTGTNFNVNGTAAFKDVDFWAHQKVTVSGDNKSEDNAGKLTIGKKSSFLVQRTTGRDDAQVSVRNYGELTVDDAELKVRGNITVDEYASAVIREGGVVTLFATGSSDLTFDNNGTLTLTGSSKLSKGDKGTVTLDNSGEILVDADSLIDVAKITGEGTITINATGFVGVHKVIDVATGGLSSDYEIKVVDEDENSTARIVRNEEGDITIIDVNESMVAVNGSWKSQADVDAALGSDSGYYFGGNAFADLKSAADAVAAGGTITVSGDETAIITSSVFNWGKSATITGKATFDYSVGNIFIGRGGSGSDRDAVSVLTFDNAIITSVSNSDALGFHISGYNRTSEDANTNDGKLIIKNSEMEIDYFINRNYAEVVGSTITIKNGFDVQGRNADESKNGEIKTAEMYIKDSTVTVLNENGMGLGREGYGKLTIENSTYSANYLNIRQSKDLVTVSNGTLKTTGNINNAGTVKVSGDSTVSGNFTGSGELVFDNAVLDSDIAASGNQTVRFTGVSEITDSSNFDVTGLNIVGTMQTVEETEEQLKNVAASTLTISNNYTAQALWVGAQYYGKQDDKIANLIVSGEDTLLYVGANGDGDNRGLNIRESGAVTVTEKAQLTVNKDDAFVVKGALNIENGASAEALSSGVQIYAGGTVTVDGGTFTIGAYNDDNVCIGSVEVGKDNQNVLNASTGSIELKNGGKLILNETLNVLNGSITMDHLSTVKYAETIILDKYSEFDDINGSFIINTTDYEKGTYLLMDYTGDGDISVDYYEELLDSLHDNFMVFNNDLYVTDAKQTTLYVNSKYTSADIALEDGRILGYNAFASVSAALTVANANGGAEIVISTVNDESNDELNDDGSTGVRINKSGTYTISGGSYKSLPAIWLGEGSKELNITAELKILDAKVAVGKLGDEVDSTSEFTLTVVNSVIDAVRYQWDGHNAGWMTFKNTEVTITNSYVNAQIEKFTDEDVAMFPRSAEDVAKAGTYKYLPAHEGYNGNATGILKSMTIEGSTYVSGFFTVRDRGHVVINNSVLYVGGGLQLGYHNDNANESWSGDRTSPENFRVGEAATMDITGSIIRYTGHGNGNADTGLMVGGKDANGGVLNITDSDFSMVADGYTGKGDDATVAAGSSINITDSEFTVDTLTNKGTVTVKGNSNAYINSVTGGITFGSAEKESIIGGVIGAKDESDMVSNSGKVYISDGSTVTLTGKLYTTSVIENSVYNYASGTSEEIKGYKLTIADGADIRAGAIYISGGSEMTVAAGGKFSAFYTDAGGFRNGTLNVYGSTMNVKTGAEVTTVINNITGDLNIGEADGESAPEVDTIYNATILNILAAKSGSRSGKVTVTGSRTVLDMSSNGRIFVGGDAKADKYYAAGDGKATLEITGGATVTVANKITNLPEEGWLYVRSNGIVSVNGGTLNVGYGIENYGKITVTDGKVAAIKYAATENTPTVIKNEGTFTVADSTITVDSFTGDGSMKVSGTSTITIGDFKGTMDFAEGAVLADESVITFSGDNDKVTADGDLALLWNKNISGVETWDIYGKLNISGVELPYGEDKVTLVDGTGLEAGQITVNGSNIVENEIVVNGVVYGVEFVDNSWVISAADNAQDPYTKMTLTAGVVQTQGTYDFTINASADYGDGGYTYTYKLNDEAIDGNTFTLAEDVKSATVTVTVYDKFGESTAVSNNITVTVIDYTKPVLEISGNPDDWTEKATLKAEVSDNFGAENVTVEYFDGTSWIAGSSLDVTENGEYQFRATDKAGNVTEQTVKVEKIDNDDPVLTVAVGGKVSPTDEDVTLSASATDKNAVSIEYSIDDGNTWNDYTGDITLSKSGKYTYKFKAVDAFGNTASETVYVWIDKDDPVLSVSSGEYAGDWTDKAVVLNTTAADETLASFKYTVDGGKTWSDYTVNSGETLSTGTVTLSNSGIYDCQFVATDIFGKSTTGSVEVKIDKADPVLTVDANGYESGVWTNKAVTLTATATDDNDYRCIEYSVDGGKTWTAGSDVVVNTNGSFEYMFRVTDAADKTEVETVKVNYDDVPAVLTVTGNPTDWIEITDSAWPVKLSASVNEADCIIEYNDYGNRWEKYDAAQGVIVYKNGTVNFKVTDKAGNITTQKVEVSKIWSDTNNDAPDTPDVPGEEFDGTVNVDKKLDIKESSTKYADVAVEMSTGNTTVNIGSGKVSSAGGVGTLAVEIGSISKADGAAGVNNVKIGKYADVKIHGTIEELGKLSTGKYTALDVDDTITGTAARQTISTGSGNNVDFADIDLKGGNDTLKIGADNSVSAGDIRNVEKISVGSRSDVDAGMITGVNRLSTSKGAAADKNDFDADGISGLLGKNDTVSFGNYNDVKLDYKVDLLSGKDTLKIGKNSSFDAPELSNVEIIKTGAGTRFLVETVNGVNKFTASGSKTSSGYIDITDLAGTAGNDTVSLGNYNDASIGTVNLGAGNDQLKLGSNSELSVDVIDFGAGNDTLSIGKNSVVSVTEIKGMETLKGSKGSTLEINNGADTDVKFDSTLKGSWNKVTVLDDAGELALGDNGINVYANEWDVFEFASPESGKLTLESSDAVKFEYRFSGADNWLVYSEGSAIALNGKDLSIRVSVDLEDNKDKFAKFSASFKAELA